MVLRKNYRPRKGNSLTRLVVALAVLLVLGLGGKVWYVYAQNDDIETKGQLTETHPSSLVNFDKTTWSILRDPDNSFEIKFPKSILKRNSKQVNSPLANEEKLKSVGLAHIIPASNCDVPNSVRCVPTTTDMAIDFFSVTRNFNDVFKELQKIYGPNMLVVTVDGHQGVRFSLGDAKEGVVYTALPINNTKTLFIKRYYLKEPPKSSLGSNLADFISPPDQKDLFDQIMSSLTFRPTL